MNLVTHLVTTGGVQNATPVNLVFHQENPLANAEGDNVPTFPRVAPLQRGEDTASKA